MAESAQEVEAIFLAALEKATSAEQSAFVAEVCGERAELRRQVSELLEAHDESLGPLDAPPPGLAGTADRPETCEQLGTVIGPYKLLQQLGEGGMGAVFMAEQAHPVQRIVALKLIKSGMNSSQIIARFEAERQALALMDHPNIAKVLDAGTTEDDLPYFVMELVKGVPITKYCDEHHLTPRERLELFVPVCQAVQHAHQKGIIHRDLKPSNVMVCVYDGQPVPKIIDFGVAKAAGPTLTERTLFTELGQVVGTLEYMSPEQAELDQLDIDTRSDIYSLGVLLYELLTGTTPLERRRFHAVAFLEVLRIIREEEAPRPSSRLSTTERLLSIAANRALEPKRLCGLVRGDLDWLVMKCLEKDRQRRYATANGLVMDLQRYLQDETVLACPPAALYRFRKFARRNKRLLATVGAIALALAGGMALSTWQAIRATKAEGLARTLLTAESAARHATQDQLLLTEQAEERAMRRLYDAWLSQARAGSLSRRVGQRIDSLDAVAKAAKIARDRGMPEQHFLELRNAAIACLALPDLHLAKQWPGWPAGSKNVDFDGRLEHYARSDMQGTVSIRRVADDAEIARLPGSGSETWPFFSPDGKFLAVESATDRRVWKLGGHEPVCVVQLPAPDCHALDFSPDSRQCAIGRLDGSISLYDLVSGQPPRQLPGSQGPARLAYHPQGRQLAVASNKSVEIRELAGGKVVAELPLPNLNLNLAWHPDGKTLALAGDDFRIHLWDVAAGKQSLVLEGFRSGGVSIAFNHTGDLLASTGWEGVLRLWDPRTGKQVFNTISGIFGPPPRFHPDDRFLSGDIRDGKLGLWEVIACREYQTLVRASAASKGEYEKTTIRLDGRLLAVAMLDGVGLWDLPSGKELAFLESPGTSYVLFEPEGALLTNGPAGLLRWPVQIEPATPDLLRIGPPQKLSVPGPICHIACSREGKVIAISQFQGASVLHADRPEQPLRLGPHDDARYIAVSPDGQMVATGSHVRTAVKVWDANSGKLVEELPVDGSHVGFSPDGKWLATTGGGVRLWAVGSWQQGAQIGSGGSFAFAPDGKLMAVETGHGVVRLVDPGTGREYARLEDPNQDRARYMCFSPDGTQLVASNTSHSIHIWDLRAIRNQLAKIGLDWDLPPYRLAEPNKDKPLRVEMVQGEEGATR